MRKRPIAIVGFVDLERAASEARATGAELWGFNDPSEKHGPLEDYSRWFDLHRKIGPEIEDYARMKCPVYMIQRREDVPTSIAYPKDEIIEHFGRRYFTNSVSWMLALAIYERRDAIHVFGVDMAAQFNDGPEELGEQRPSVEFWLGYAQGSGALLHIPEWSDLLKTNVLYGFGDHADSPWLKMKLRAKTQRDLALRYENLAAQCRGSAEAFEAMLDTWALTEEDETK